MTDAKRQEKIRTAAAHTAALAAARKAMKQFKYGQKEHSAPTNKDISLGWGQTSWNDDR